MILKGVKREKEGSKRGSERERERERSNLDSGSRVINFDLLD